MNEQNKQPDAKQTKAGKDVGAGEGGAKTGEPGNILAGVQPAAEKDEQPERRHD